MGAFAHAATRSEMSVFWDMTTACRAITALCVQVACGVSHTLFLVDADEKQLEPFQIFEPETTIEDEPKPTVKHGTLVISPCEGHAHG